MRLCRDKRPLAYAFGSDEVGETMGLLFAFGYIVGYAALLLAGWWAAIWVAVTIWHWLGL